LRKPKAGVTAGLFNSSEYFRSMLLRWSVAEPMLMPISGKKQAKEAAAKKSAAKSQRKSA
jgi:hypothetical protein